MYSCKVIDNYLYICHIYYMYSQLQTYKYIFTNEIS